MGVFVTKLGEVDRTNRRHPKLISFFGLISPVPVTVEVPDVRGNVLDYPLFC